MLLVDCCVLFVVLLFVVLLFVVCCLLCLSCSGFLVLAFGGGCSLFVVCCFCF